jgi:hypothetical protein
VEQKTRGFCKYLCQFRGTASILYVATGSRLEPLALQQKNCEAAKPAFIESLNHEDISIDVLKHVRLFK